MFCEICLQSAAHITTIHDLFIYFIFKFFWPILDGRSPILDPPSSILQPLSSILDPRSSILDPGFIVHFEVLLISLACVSGETHNLQSVFGPILDTNTGSLCQAFLEETVGTGTKNRCVIEATHVWERLNFELFRNVSVHKFYRLKALITLEQVNTTEWSKKNKNLN